MNARDWEKLLGEILRRFRQAEIEPLQARVAAIEQRQRSRKGSRGSSATPRLRTSMRVSLAEWGLHMRMILAPVGKSMQLVDHDLFSAIHEQLGEQFRRHGFDGEDLDYAIARALPDALEWALYGDRGTVH
jgi:hypothetical protein